MTNLWQVEIAAADRADIEPRRINDRLEAFSEALSLFDATVAGSPLEPIDGMRRYSALLSIESDGPVDALITGLTAFNPGAKKADLPEFPIVRCEILRWDEFERRLDEPAVPELIGISEIAELLGVTRQRASQLARTATFPLPAAELASGPVWLEPNIRQFVANWSRIPGRPRNASAIPSTSSVEEVKRMAKSRRTGAKAGKAASKVLRSKGTGKSSKTAAASALSQRAPKRSGRSKGK
jgi:hypothetical protein